MKLSRVLRLFIIILCLFIFSPVHSMTKGIVLFNNEPITAKNALHDNKVFREGSRVYYLFIYPKRIKSEFIRVQVFKMTDNAPWGGYDVVRTYDARVMKDEKYYYSDYFTFHEKGKYGLQVFSHRDFVRPLAVNYFYVQ